MQAKITLIGLHEWLYDPNTKPKGLFTNLSVPAGTLDVDTLAATILMRGGDYEVLYPNPVIMESFITVWSTKWAATIQRWYNAFTAQYDPISNYDRHEIWTDTGSGTGTTSGRASGTTNDTGTDTREDTTSAYDVATYSPKDKDTETRNLKSTTLTSENGKSDYSNTTTHDGHLYGNIGVTTNQQMIEAEYNLFKINLYNEVADLFLKEFVIPVR